MKCSVCGSTDIVSITGQNFCINCGSQVKSVESASSPAPKVDVKAAPVAVEVAPKAAPVETKAVPVKPEPSAMTVKVDKVPGPKPAVKKAPRVVNPAKPMAAPVIINHKSTISLDESAEAVKVVPTTAPKMIEPTKPKAAIVSKPEPKRPVAKPVSRKAKTAKPHLKPALEPAPVKSSHPALNLKAQIPAHHDEHPVKPHPLRFVIGVAAGVSLPLAAALAAALILRFNTEITLYIVISGVALFAIMLTLSEGALLYGLSRNQDGRPAPRWQWWRAARSGFMDVLNVNLMTLIKLSAIAILGFLGWKLVLGYVPTVYYAREAALVLLNGFLAWAVVGSIAARRIAVPAVVIGGLTAGAGIKLGWQTYTRAGGHLMTAMAEVLISRLIALTLLLVAVMVAGPYVIKLDETLMAAATAGLIAVTAFVALVIMLQIENRIWLKQYRTWMALYFPKQRMRLLSGRIQASVRR